MTSPHKKIENHTMKNAMTNPHEYGVNSTESGSLKLIKVEK
jgi:hypothetical protein